VGQFLPPAPQKEDCAWLLAPGALSRSFQEDAGVRQRFAEISQEIFPREQQNPQALAALQKAEIEKWWPIVNEANIKAE
jgi:hypothetical protein